MKLAMMILHIATHARVRGGVFGRRKKGKGNKGCVVKENIVLINICNWSNWMATHVQAMGEV